MNMQIAKPENQTMSSRDIASLVESRHVDVCRSIDRLMGAGAISGYAPTAYTHPQNGQQYSEYLIGKRDSYVVVAQLSPQFTARLVDRWQELETAQSQTVALPDFSDPVAAARAWADAKESEQKALIKLESAKPAIEFVERYVEASGLFGFREVCKQLEAKEPKFRAFLQSQRIMYRLGGGWTPHAQWLDAGYFESKTGESNGHAYTDPKFTARGVEWVARRWSQYLERNPENKPSLLQRALADNRIR